VVLDNKNVSGGVNATVDLGAAVGSASAIYLLGAPGGSLTVPAASVTLAGAQTTPAGVWNRNPPYIQTTSSNSVSVYVPAASTALVRVLQWAGEAGPLPLASAFARDEDPKASRARLVRPI
jgi:hypothetical protein